MSSTSTLPQEPLPTPAHVSPSLGDAWPANIKLMFDQYMASMAQLNAQSAKRMEELDAHFDSLITDSRQAQNKLVADAQSAANLALLNAVNNSDALAKQSLVNSTLSGQNEQVEQQTGATMSQSQMNAQLTSLNAQLVTLVAILGQIAVGRPPANPTGTVGPQAAATTT